jgi:hypothetical protein
MFNKYFCNKYQSKKVTLRVIVDKLVSEHPLFFWGIGAPLCMYCLYDMYTNEGPMVAFGILLIAITLSLARIFDYITVATCPLKKND